MNANINKRDKVNILFRTGIKVVRGCFRRLFLKETHGMLLVGKNVQISHGKHIRCGKNVKFEDFSEIHGLCSDGLNFGDYVTISRGVMIRPSSYYGGDYGIGMTIGEHSSIGPYGYVGCSGKITIGKNVMFGPKCSLFAENHVFSDTENSIKSQGVKQKGITIEDDCWIGSNVTILDGVTIGKGSVIGAGTLVTKDIPAGSIVVDKRNKKFRSRNDMIETIEADKKRWGGVRNLIFLPQFRILWVKRKCEYWREKNKAIFALYRIVYQKYKIKYMMDIPARVKIGKGLRIEHIGGIVINPDAELGENITLLNGVLIGAQNRGRKKGFPVIGNYVWIGTNAIIVGKIHIGNNVLIAPGAYVNFDVPDNSIVLGNPGKIIANSNATEGYIVNPV